jgi:uncharacterized membrane protein YeiB
MNIEWFNRPLAAFNEGMPRGLTGADWLASWFVAYFVQGKFWTIFSLLFGMGFAVMLVRAERAGRAFIEVYLRRILALAVFGALHFIYVWEGDILFSYAVGALALLIVLYGRARPLLLAGAALVGLGLVTDSDLFFRVAGGVAAAALLALYLRGEKRLAWRGVSVPLASFIMMLAGAAMAVAAAVLWLLPDGPLEPRVPLTVFGPLAARHRLALVEVPRSRRKRSLRMAVGLYVFAGVAMTSMSLVKHFAPDPVDALASAAGNAGRRLVERRDRERHRARRVVGPADDDAASCVIVIVSGHRHTEGEEDARRARRGHQGRAREGPEGAGDSQGRRDQGLHDRQLSRHVDWRARRFLEKAASDAGFGVLLVSMFLLGAWFVRSGVMNDTARHLAVFRKLALYGLPLGIGLGALTASSPSRTRPGDRHDGWGIARGLVMLGNLPACLGYVGLVVTMLHNRTAASRSACSRRSAGWRSPTICSSRSSAWRSSTDSARPLGTAARRAGAVRGGGVRRAGRVQPLVAGALPLRADGMALARLHVPAGAADAARRRPLGGIVLHAGKAPAITPVQFIAPFPPPRAFRATRSDTPRASRCRPA